jgi:hypothetical protein
MNTRYYKDFRPKLNDKVHEAEWKTVKLRIIKRTKKVYQKWRIIGNWK